MSNDIQDFFDLEAFKASKTSMLPSGDRVRFGSIWERQNHFSAYTIDEIINVIETGTTAEKIALSDYFFKKCTPYRRIVLHYATFLRYTGLVIPHTKSNLSDANVQKKYGQALKFVDEVNIPNFLTECAQKLLTRGAYFGIISYIGKDGFAVIELPAQWCRTNYKDIKGNWYIDFNLNYFNTLPTVDETGKPYRQIILEAYPDDVVEAYAQNMGGWYTIPINESVCFKCTDGIPPFVSTIGDILKYNQAVDLGLKREAADIRRILVQKIPHLNDGRFLMEPDEAAELHRGVRDMLANNEDTDVLTTYADVDSIQAVTSNESTQRTIEKAAENMYLSGGLSQQLFNAAGSSTIEFSLDNDLSYVRTFANQFQSFVSQLINRIFGNAQVSFSYTILPISDYNAQDYIDSTFKLAQYGYPILPAAVACGISQRDVIDLKKLENGLKIVDDLFIPLQSAATQAKEDEGGRPELKAKDKSAKTQKNEAAKASSTSKQ